MRALFACLILVGLGGCGAGAEEPPAAAQPVTVAPEGTRFDPPVAASTLPDGAWYCAMGDSTHYAAMHEGDGKCPECGMRLKQRAHADAAHAH